MSLDILHSRGYEVLNELGRGSYGVALLVRRQASLYVAKLQPHAHLSHTGRKALAREVHLLASLARSAHPNIVCFRHSFYDSATLCIIMDYAEQGDLGKLIARRRANGAGFVENAFVQRIMFELVSALDFLHARDVMHRDVKPRNVFLSRNRALLGDLGLSKSVVGSGGVAAVESHTQCGSPLYVAPEVHMNQPYNAAVDVWGLGCTMYELMMLEPAFRGNCNQETMRAIVNGKYKPISNFWSPKLREIISSTLRVRASERPSAFELLCDEYLVTDQQSEDWWVRFARQRDGPAPESVERVDLEPPLPPLPPSPAAPTPSYATRDSTDSESGPFLEFQLHHQATD